MHGGLNQYRLSDKNEYLDLSVNLNPYGPNLNLSLTSQELSAYPDPHCSELRSLLAEERGCSEGEILFGNGASELIWAAARSLLKEGDRALCVKPSFSEFQTALSRTPAKLVEFECFEEDDFKIDLKRLDQSLRESKAALFSLCNPNSPSGSYLKAEEIQWLASRHPGAIFLLDESFLSLSLHHEASHASYPVNVLRIVSLTKDHAIAGIRLGYAMGAESLLEKLKDEIPSWSVNALAQKIGLNLFSDKDFLKRSREFIFRDKTFLEDSFRERSIPYISSCTVFCMFKDPREDLCSRLLDEHKILIRSCASYGLKDWYRIAVRPRAEMQRFFTAMDSLYKRD